jgi:hypothetical protein
MKEELEELLSPERFSPFIVTRSDGFSIAIPSPKRALVGRRMLVVSDEEGNLYHFPVYRDRAPERTQRQDDPLARQ